MPADSDRAYIVGLKLLATRELAESQLRERLTRRKFESDDVEAALARLRAERALDDRRTAAAYARTEANLRGRGKIRVLRRLTSMGIAADVARDAVGNAFEGLDENERIATVLAKRLRPGETIADPKVAARLHRYLLSQGFAAGDVSAVFRKLRGSALDMTSDY